MRFFTTSREIAELRKQVETLSRALASVNQPPSFDPQQMLAISMDGQAKQLASTSDFIRMVHEIALERFASSMGRRGGRKRAATAQRDKNGRMLPAKRVNQNDCILCDDPNAADFSIAQFEAHQGHKRGRYQSRPARETREDADEIAFETEATPTSPASGLKPQYPLPYVEREIGGSGSGSSAENGSSSSPNTPNHEGHVH